MRKCTFRCVSVYLPSMSTQTIFIKLLALTSSFFAFIPFVLALIRKKYLTKDLKIIWLFLTIGLITDLASEILTFYFKLSNLEIYNIYIILETLLISFFYYLILPNKISRFLIFSIILFFLIYSIYNVSFNPAKSLDGIILTIESTSIILFSVITFNEFLKNSIYSNILASPIFWINSGFLIFFSGNLFLHIFSNFLQVYELNAFFELWVFHSVFNIILYILISIGFWKSKISQI